MLSNLPHPFVTHLSVPNQSSIYDTSGKIIELSYIYDEPTENLVILF